MINEDEVKKAAETIKQFCNPENYRSCLFNEDKTDEDACHCFFIYRFDSPSDWDTEKFIRNAGELG